jgi:3,4-dihydroxy 2-butanone 4-phosphate synthase / GTP cyclohydrolase II
MENEFATIQEAIVALQQGKPILVVDDEDRENEGDLVYAAEFITDKDIAFMLQHTSGIICVPTTEDRLKELDLPLMVDKNTSRYGCSFTVSVDAKGCHTGVSAADRLLTIQKLVSGTKNNFVKPGHIFPLRAVPGGVLKRVGHTEAVVDLCSLAKLQPVGVLCEMMHKDGTMMRLPALQQFSQEHTIPLIRIADLIHYRYEREQLVVRQDAIDMPTQYGDFTLLPYKDEVSGTVHLALMKGNVTDKNAVLVRVHSECLTGDVFGSKRCDCGWQFDAAMRMIAQEGSGVLLYMRQEGRGIGLMNKLKAYHLQEKGYDTVEANNLLGFKADLRHYGIGAQILRDLGVTNFRLLTNNPKKVVGLEGYGLYLTERVPLQSKPNDHNASYLETKKEKLGHLFDKVDKVGVDNE